MAPAARTRVGVVPVFFRPETLPAKADCGAQGARWQQQRWGSRCAGLRAGSPLAPLTRCAATIKHALTVLHALLVLRGPHGAVAGRATDKASRLCASALRRAASSASAHLEGRHGDYVCVRRTQQGGVAGERRQALVRPCSGHSLLSHPSTSSPGSGAAQRPDSMASCAAAQCL
jgi:hypothetical protein